MLETLNKPKKIINEIYYSDDYIGLEAGNLEFYYGYEVVKDESSDESEWCFQVKKSGKEVFKLTTSEINQSIGECPFRDIKDYLIAGITIWSLSKESNS